MLADEVVDVAITGTTVNHREAIEDPTWVYRKFAHNQTILVGPGNDPAQVRDAADGADAFRRIVGSSSQFVSHAGDTELHAREESYWRNALVRPPRMRLLVSQTGVIATLTLASQQQAYTLVNEAVFRRFADRLNLSVLFTRDRGLLSMCAAVYASSNDRARAFGEWLTRGAGRELVAGYRVARRPAFTMWLDGCPDTQPGLHPCRPGPAGKPIKDDVVFVDSAGPPANLQEMKSQADAVVVARYTGTSREISWLRGRRADPPAVAFERWGEFEILDILKPHAVIPPVGMRAEIVVPGSYQEFPTYVLHTLADGVEEPEQGHTYVIFLAVGRWRSERSLRSAWNAYSIIDISGPSTKPLASSWPALGNYTPEQFLAVLRR
jgi:ABC-type tungstate transport system permease subunit